MEERQLSPENALSLIRPFGMSDWVSITATDVKITKLKGGYCNSILLIRSKGRDGDTNEPRSLVIRLKGGNIVDLEDVTFNNDTTSKVVAFEMSKRFIGPHFIGVISSGSIEEYISGHTLTWKDAMNENISKDIALALARVHSIKGVPLRSDSFEVMLKRIRKNAKKFATNTNALTKHECLSMYSNVNVSPMVDFDFESQVKWLAWIVTQVKLRNNLILLDMNFLNCMVRSNPKVDESSVVLIDYDLAQYNFRGIDLGAHFFFRVFQWDNPISKIITDTKFPSIEERCRFLKIYQQEIKRLELWEDFDEHGIDSVENLLIESLIGQLIHVCFFLAWFLSKCDMFLSFDAAFLEINSLRVKSFNKAKEELISIIGERYRQVPTNFEISLTDSSTVDLSTLTGDLEPADALRIVEPFFTDEWAKTQPKDVSVSVLAGGLCSTIWKVSKTSDAYSEPATLLIKKKGGNSVDVDDFGFNETVALKILTNEISNRGLGPKVYGLIDGGSIEEFIPSHTLTAIESADPILSRDFAINLAQIHAINNAPLQTDGYEHMLAKVSEYSKVIQTKREVYEKANLPTSEIDNILSFDFESEKAWLMDIVPKFRMRKNLVLVDLGYMNCLVRETIKDEQSSVVLIDYDLAQYNFRGIDLGDHFFSRIFASGGSTYKLDPSIAFPSMEEKRRFCYVYQQEIKRLNIWEDFDEHGIDSIENLLIESQVGQMITNLFFNAFCLSKPEIFMHSKAPFIYFIPFCLRYHYEQREEITNLIGHRL